MSFFCIPTAILRVLALLKEMYRYKFVHHKSILHIDFSALAEVFVEKFFFSENKDFKTVLKHAKLQVIHNCI